MILIIGCGNMGSAIASSLINKNYTVSLYDSAVERTKIKGAVSLKSLSEAKNIDTIILALKSDALFLMYEEIRKINARLIISIAAGVTIKTLEENLYSAKIVRFMPNIAAVAEKSVTAISFGNGLDEKERNKAIEIAESFGSHICLDESLFHAFIGLSGSGLAFILSFMHSAALGGVMLGLSYSSSLSLVKETAESAVALLNKTSLSPTDLITKICSAKGTTIEGIKALEDGLFSSTVINAVVKAGEKSSKMSEEGER